MDGTNSTPLTPLDLEDQVSRYLRTPTEVRVGFGNIRGSNRIVDKLLLWLTVV